MSYSLQDYDSSGILICLDELGSDAGMSDAGLALNSNFKALQDKNTFANGVQLSGDSAVFPAVAWGDQESALAIYQDHSMTVPAILFWPYKSNWPYDDGTDIGNATSIVMGSGNVVPGEIDFDAYNAIGSDGFSGLALVVGNEPSSPSGYSEAMRLYAANSGTGAGPRAAFGGVTDDGSSTLQTNGKTSLDSGMVTTDGLGTLCLHPQSTAPTPVAGGIYFDGTNFNFCTDGSMWVPLSLP